jgi:hypothetical protein
MIHVIKSAERYHHRNDWLSTYWHFSFDHYWDPNNVSFGPLRVFNDDVVEPHTGFPMHPHRDMEIITYVLAGELEHEDSLGNRGIVRAGEIQVMSAGTGIVHAERNPSDTTPLHLLQIWIEPRTLRLPPRWEQRTYSPSERQDALYPVVTSDGRGQSLRIDQDAAISISAPSPGHTITHMMARDRRGYLFVIEGNLKLNGLSLSGGDQARITQEPRLSLTASEPSELILLDLP